MELPVKFQRHTLSNATSDEHRSGMPGNKLIPSGVRLCDVKVGVKVKE